VPDLRRILVSLFIAPCTYSDQGCSGFSSRRREGAGFQEPQSLWSAFPARSSRTPCPENRTQKIFGTRPCPNKAITTNMVLPALLWLTAWAIKMLKRIKEVERRTNQPFWVNQRLLWFSVPAPFFLRKQSDLIKDHLIFLDVISGPRQFTG
jgi:hypothetical protein